MYSPRRSKAHVQQVNSKSKRPELFIRFSVDSRHRRFNWLWLITGIALIGVFTFLVIAGVVIIRRKIRSESPSSVLADHASTANHKVVDPGTVIAITAVPTANPTPSYTCTDLQGQVLEKTFNSAVAQDAVPYRIYLPPCYTQTNRRYPYVILLHGAGNDETEWTDMLGVNQILDQGIAMGKLPPMILVMPYGGELQYENTFTDGASFEAVILNDLMPEIENNYCTWNTQSGRALAGISRGGFWAFEIGFRHPDLFGALAGHSAYFDPTNAPPANNPLNLAQTVTFTGAASGSTPRLWLDVAADDEDTRQNLDVFAQTLSARQINPGYTVYPTGEHVAAYWESHMAAYLTFYGQNWPLNPLLLPLCK